MDIPPTPVLIESRARAKRAMERYQRIPIFHRQGHLSCRAAGSFISLLLATRQAPSSKSASDALAKTECS
jgi:hypothetical protein